MEAPEFWNDPSVSQKKMQELKSMKDDMATYKSLEGGYEDIETMIEMGYEENDASLIPEIQEMLDDFVAESFSEIMGCTEESIVCSSYIQRIPP